jgi:O-antigen/teichoic acid export membrane protein
MTRKHDLRKSSAWALAEVVVSSLGLFLILKTVLFYLGTEALGIWSLVIASTVLLRIGDASISAVIPRFVGAAFSSDQLPEARGYADTALLASFFMHTIFGVLLYLPLGWAIQLTLDARALPVAMALLPFAIIAFVLSSIAQAAQAVVVGLYRADAKSVVAVLAMILQMLILWLLIGRFGLMAMVMAQIGQSIFIIVAARLLARRILNESFVSVLSVRFGWTYLREIYSIGLKMQFTQIASLGFDPLVKFALAASFGLQTVAYFEIANRVAAQARQLVVMPTQALLPIFASTYSSDIVQFRQHLTQSMANIVIFSAALAVLVSAASPVISFLIANRIENELVAFIVIITFGWMMNAVAAPHFLAAIGADISRWNMMGQVFSTVAAPMVIWALTDVENSMLSVAAAMTMLAVGAAGMIWFNSVSLGVQPFPTGKQITAVISQLKNIRNG